MPEPLAPAAAAPAEPSPPSELAPWTRLRRAMLTPSRAQLVVGLLLAALGFGAVTQVRANDITTDYAGYRQQDLIDVLEGLSAATQRSRREIDQLQATRDRLSSDRTNRQAALAQAQQRADQLAILAGLVAVEGPGITITVSTPGQTSLELLLDILQELRTAGAEAIEVNDSIRVVAQTALDVSSAGVVIDGTTISGELRIEAIGDPRTLREGVTFSRGPQERVEEAGGRFDVVEQDLVEIGTVRTLEEPEFAAPAN